MQEFCFIEVDNNSKSTKRRNTYLATRYQKNIREIYHNFIPIA